MIDKLPASLEAIRSEADRMLVAIDEQRAVCFVQQVANGHDDDGIFQIREGNPITYAERIVELDQIESNLRDALPPAVVRQLAVK